MSLGLIGRKIGMTRIFTENGNSLPVTVIDVSNNRVTQLKSIETDGYTAVQLAYGKKKTNRLTKSIIGHYTKASAEAGSVLKEFRVNPDEGFKSLSVGMIIKADIFHVGQKVDISGITIGKGYAGTIKRHNFASNRGSHGNSKAHNKPGSIGMAQDPGRVFPGKRMSGHMGNVKRTTQNLEVLRVDNERNFLMIKGSVPGSKGGNITVCSSIKSGI
ncbi:50S ribosomal protein L3 [Nitrosomonas sp. JL21]|uniref:50S ribosomal protein L3 n=1 Tax=Nitrosomonas sp. JL21 TaxID=153949 RepID=UPI0013715D67|nr:50S ribosomal protein L3 [Nitrosomonas sp. JL21]MBL8498302.1 50S ribosomal protein L3 [Nitrosomonas sp.]MXS77666.1 50S ribosomal protein L3 [Nitrosomonas sp. JL21]